MRQEKVFADHLPLAIVQAITLWKKHRKKRELPYRGRITEKWFNTFVGEWRVARTIASRKRNKVLKLLNKYARSVRKSTNPAKVVDILADELRTFGSRRRLRPISLASKIAFFLRPDEMTPMDSLALKELKVRAGSSYQEFLKVFNGDFEHFENRIAIECKARWVSDLTERVGLPKRLLNERMFHRKVFDNILWIRGRERASQHGNID